MTGSLNAYAKHRKAAGLPGGSLMAVQKARDTGRISVAPDGRIDFEAADAAWKRNTNARQSRPPKKSAGAGTAKPSVTTTLSPSEPPAQDEKKGEYRRDDGRDDGSFLEAQRQREWERVKKERLDNLVREGELLSRDEVISQVGGLITTAKTKLRGIGAKVAPDLAAETNAAKCQEMVDSEIDEALRAICKWTPSDMKHT